jgi:tetratricopeptide (TPR) repeat protein
MATIFEALAMGIQHHRAGRLQAAEQIYRQILQAEPNQADAWHLLGLIAQRVGKERQINICRIVAFRSAKAAFFRGAKGDNHFCLGPKHAIAIESLGHATRINPAIAAFQSNLGLSYQAIGNLDQAAACWQRSMDLKPDHFETHIALGNVLKDQGKPDEAVTCYRQAVKLKPDHAEAHINLGNALKEQGKLARRAGFVE